MSQTNYVRLSKTTVKDFINNSGLSFTDISTEAVRRYHFKNDEVVVIPGPLMLHVSRTGGHRIYDENGVSHYVPKGWLELTWVAKAGEANFVK